MTGTSKKWTEQLRRDKDWKLRREAALALGYLGEASSYPDLVRSLDDPDCAVRQAAILSIGRLGVSEAVAELTKPKVLASEDPATRRTAIAVLGEIGGVAIADVISESIDDPDWTVKIEAISVVSKLIDRLSENAVPESARALVRMLPIDDPDIREKTIRALGEFGQSAMHVLVEALGVDSKCVRSGAAAALGLVGDPVTVSALVHLLTDDSKQVRLSAISALGNIPSLRAVAPLIDRLSDCDRDVRDAAVRTLSRMGDGVVDPLVEALELSRSEEGTAGIIKALAGFEDGRSLIPILNHLGHTFMTVRQAAIDGVVRYGKRAIPDLVDMLLLNKVPVEPLVKDLRTNRHKRNRLRTIRALGELKDSRAVPALKKAGQGEDKEISEAVEEALRRIGSATWSRASATEALGQIGDPEAVPALLRCLRDPNSTVRLRGARALVGVGDPGAAGGLARILKTEEDAEVRLQAVGALGIIGIGNPAAVRACINALADPSRSVRSRAAQALGRLASPKAALPLVKALGDSYWSVRRDAENSLTSLGPRAVPPLVESLTSRKRTVRIRAARILGIIGDRRALTPLRKLLKTEKDASVVTAAKAAVAKLTEIEE